MAQITLGGAPASTVGELPQVGSEAPAFLLTKTDMGTISLDDLKGKKVVLNIFPSVDTGVCAMSVREFNQRATSLDNTAVVCISMDLPFAQARFCGAEGIENVIMGSGFNNSGQFGKDYGVAVSVSAFTGLYARAIVVIDESGKVSHTELVPEIGHEPNYDAAVAVL